MNKRPLPRLAASLLAGVSLTAGAVLPTVSAAPEAARSFGLGGLLQAGLGLTAVLALIVLCGWAARRLGLRQSGSGSLLRVVAGTMVGQRERVVVVEVAGTWLVLGVAAGRVQALHAMPAQNLPDAQPVPAPGASPAAAAFSQRLLESLGKLNQYKKRD